MTPLRIALPIVAGATLAGCGTYVPSIQEVGDSVDGQQLVQAVVTNVTCEVQNAVYDLYQDYPKGTFLDGWGVQMTLTLSVNEKGSLNPTVNWLPPSPADAIFNLAGTGTLSADATRTNKLNAYHLVRDLREARCPEANRPGGPFMMQSDLKLKELLYNAITAERTESIDPAVAAMAAKSNAFSHDVKFQVISSGGLTPTWKLTRVTVNPSGTFLSASRTRTHELIVTLGPASKEIVAAVDKQGKPTTVIVARPASQAEGLHLSSMIGAAVAESVANALRP